MVAGDALHRVEEASVEISGTSLQRLRADVGRLAGRGVLRTVGDGLRGAHGTSASKYAGACPSASCASGRAPCSRERGFSRLVLAPRQGPLCRHKRDPELLIGVVTCHNAAPVLLDAMVRPNPGLRAGCSRRTCSSAPGRRRPWRLSTPTARSRSCRWPPPSRSR